ncbi:MAG: bacillithiol biosynthesis cysteine-adding enzyme BshC [Ignavibacteriales bacterium]
MFINFSDLPGQQNLFLDYLYEFDNVKDFYKKNFRDTESFHSHFIELIQKDRKHRGILPGILKQQYAQLTPSPKTLENIELLESAKTLVIVTGQQLGLYGGPLYTFYKIMTAIKLSAYMKEKYQDLHFAPVFWLEGDDHDFEEVRSVNLIDENNEIAELCYNDNEPEEVNRGSVGKIAFTENINSVNSELDKILRDNDFKAQLMEKITSFYKEGETFKGAFKKLIFDLFDEYGLIIFDPQDKEIKNILKPVFRKEIEEFSEHTKDVVKISAELEEIYHAQVKVNPVNLFFSDDDGRYLIEPADDDFRLKSKRKKIPKTRLLELLDNEPERFSPNVLLRPVCQDYIFPTAFYIGGPGEISYFAQVIPLYKFFDVTQPVIYPRSSLTIVEKNVQKIIDRYNLNYSDFLNEKEALFEKVIKSLSDIEIDIEFQKCEKEINSAIDSLKEKLLTIDKTLSDSTAKTNDKIIQAMGILKEKSREAQKKRHEATIRQLNKSSNVIYPKNNLQERELSYIYFVHKYGMDILKWIFNELAINKFEHQVIEL